MSRNKTLVLNYKENDDQREIIETTFGDRTLVWDATYCRKAEYKPEKFDLFKELNAYLAIQPIEVSEALFAMYAEVHDVLLGSESVRKQIQAIARAVRRAGTAFNFQAARKFVEFGSHVVIPSNFERAYVQKESFAAQEGMPTGQSHRASSREKTYLYDDYVELVAFTLLMRLITPIWGSLIVHLVADTGSSFKEYIAGYVIAGCPQITNSAGYKKLYTYTTAMTANAEKSNSTVMDGIPKDDFPLWVFYLIMVRRISVGDIRGIGVNKDGKRENLATYVYTYLSHRVINNSDSFTFKKLNDKKANSSRAQDEESKLTDFEAVRINEENTPGHTQEMRFYFAQQKMIIDAICPQLDMNLLREAQDAVAGIANEVTHMPQERILRWVLGPYLPPVSLSDVDKAQLNDFLAIVMAMFWQHGLKDMAAIISLTEYKKSGSGGIITQITRSNIPAALIEEAKLLYPHYRRASGKVAVTKPEPIPVTLVKTMTNELLDRDWQLNLPRQWTLEQANTVGLRQREYRIPSDIRIQLMKLVLRIGRHKLPFHPGVTE
mgnify:CR=1 FL=1